MIHSIKIYDKNGILKQEISKEEAVKLYSENNKSEWKLSPTERRHWKNLLVREPIRKNIYSI